MTLRILPSFAAFATLGFVSCYPYPEPPPGQQPPVNQTVTSHEQQRLEEQRAKMKAAAEREKQNNPEANTGPMTNPNETPPTKPQVEPKRDYPFATTVPGKEGFVFSPYNNKVIDVRDMPTGTLVQDPTYPAAEKKYFRVP